MQVARLGGPRLGPRVLFPATRGAPPEQREALRNGGPQAPLLTPYRSGERLLRCRCFPAAPAATTAAAAGRKVFFSTYYAPKALWRRNHPPPLLLETGAPPRGSPNPRDQSAAASVPFTLAKQQRLLEQLAKEGSTSSSGGGLVYKGRVVRKLSVRRVKHGGRNCTGQITVRHRGGGHAQRLRFVDWRRSRKDVWGTVLRIEHDPSHSAGIGLLQQDDGLLSYVPVSAVTRPGDRILASDNAPIQPGCCLPLQRIPVGTIVYAVELSPGRGAQLARAAGAYATVLNKDSSSATLRLPSGELRLLSLRCWACIGQAMQPAAGQSSSAGAAGGPAGLGYQGGGGPLAAALGASKAPPPLGKAGASRWRGRRPAVRGKAMNAAKHPHGGGTSQKKIGRPPVSLWGIQRTGYRTRREKQESKTLGLFKKLFLQRSLSSSTLSYLLARTERVKSRRLLSEHQGSMPPRAAANKACNCNCSSSNRSSSRSNNSNSGSSNYSKTAAQQEQRQQQQQQEQQQRQQEQQQQQQQQEQQRQQKQQQQACVLVLALFTENLGGLADAEEKERQQFGDEHWQVIRGELNPVPLSPPQDHKNWGRADPRSRASRRCLR
ncbi:hypothetical protein Esti_005178 [Eimeria stiedai]